jgi:conjugative relaxase-like TrwC/TraI family protein
MNDHPVVSQRFQEPNFLRTAATSLTIDNKMLTIRAMSDGAGYAERHLIRNDYYSKDEQVVGHWFGKGAEQLGLVGEVKLEDFEAVRQQLDPATGEELRPRTSADRVNEDGTVQSKGRNLYDCTVSAPKSVSVMAIVGGDERLIEAHRKAVAEMLHQTEAIAATRVRMNGANEDRTTGNVVMACYEHDSSRELDPLPIPTKPIAIPI